MVRVVTSSEVYHSEFLVVKQFSGMQCSSFRKSVTFVISLILYYKTVTDVRKLKNCLCAGFELTFQSCIMKNSNKIPLLLVSPPFLVSFPLFLDLPPIWFEGQKFLSFAYCRLLEKCIFHCTLSCLARASYNS